MRFNIFQTSNEIFLIIPIDVVFPIGTTEYEMIGHPFCENITVKYFQREDYKHLFFEIPFCGYNIIWDLFNKNTIHEIQRFLISNSIKIELYVLEMFFDHLNLPY